MKKIMFDDRYGLTDAVLSGRKTQTRRIIPPIEVDWVRRGLMTFPVGGFEYGVLFMDVRSVLPDAGIRDYSAPRKYQPKYQKGETVAIAQSYNSLNERGYLAPEWLDHTCEDSAGYDNKMFVRADLMPHGIRITNVRIEHLQDISDEDCMKEGIMEGEFMNTWDRYYFDEWGDVANHITFRSPREAYKALIDRISGKGTWERNPWVYVYDFELVELE